MQELRDDTGHGPVGLHRFDETFVETCLRRRPQPVGSDLGQHQASTREVADVHADVGAAQNRARGRAEFVDRHVDPYPFALGDVQVVDLHQ